MAVSSKLYTNSLRNQPFYRRLSGIFLTVLLLAVPAASVSGQEFRFMASPEMVFPLSDQDVFGLGGGGTLLLNVDLFGFLAPYADLKITAVAPPSSSVDSSLVLFSGGTGLSVFGYPLPRLKVSAFAGGGFYIGSFRTTADTVMTGNLFYRAGVEAGYRLSPGMTLAGSLAYTDYRTEFDSFYRGMGISFVADLGLKSKYAEGRTVLDSAESLPVFPIRAQDYQKQTFGTVRVRNGESAEIRNLEIWFSSEGYTSAPILCASLPYLGRNETTEAPLLAAFSEQVMGITENVRVNGEIRMSYELLGEKRSSRAEVTVSILNRNALTWEDPRILSAFVSPNDPAVLDMSKFLAGVVRSLSRPELDSNLQYAMGIFEGLRLAGIAWSADPQTPYAGMHGNPGDTDYVQYPHQTLAYRGGDSDDIAVLYASALESVGVPAALLPMDDEVIALFKMSSTAQATRSMFSSPEDFLFLGDDVWVPLKVSVLREGFLQAWSEGAAVLAEAGNGTEGITERFYRISDGWRRYAPAGVPGIVAATQKPAESQISRAFDSVVSLIIKKEVEPQVARLRGRFGPDGGNGRQRNSLGILYARYGMYPEALEEFKASYALGEIRAIMNIGNVAFLMKDFNTAAEWYRRAMEEMPDGATAMISLARTLYELDRFDEADALFQEATSREPNLTDRYSYLSARVQGTAARASAAATERSGNMIWDE